MAKDNKKIILLIVGVVIILILGNQLDLFTSWGQANDCSVNPDKTKILSHGDRVDCDDYCSYDKCAIDIWKDSKIYLTQYSSPPNPDWEWYREEAGDGEYYTCSNSQSFCLVEIYCCPEQAPAPEDHSTRAYVCENGVWDSKSRYDFDDYCSYDTSGVDLCWCSDEGDNFYIDENDGVHCRSSPFSSWCSAYTAHETKQCYGGDVYWYDSLGDRDDRYQDCGTDHCEAAQCYECIIDSHCSSGNCENKQCVVEDDCKNNNQACIPGLGQCCSGLTCYGICLGAGEYTAHDSKKCYNNDVYWYDSLDDRNDKYQECGSAGCLNGACVTTGNGDGADTNGDGTISFEELIAYANQWVDGDVSFENLINAANMWV